MINYPRRPAQPQRPQDRAPFKVMVSNFPLMTSTVEIDDLLQTVCSFATFYKTTAVNSSSALVSFQDLKSAQKCESTLKYRKFRGRELMTRFAHELGEADRNHREPPEKEADSLEEQILKLNEKDREELFGLLGNLKSEQELFKQFLLTRMNLIRALLGQATHNN